jgi:lipoprotein-anchoring transpeptidase ErfK/SrfK
MRPSPRHAAPAVALAGLLCLGSCADLPVFGALTTGWQREAEGGIVTPDYGRVYAALRGEKAPVGAVDASLIDPAFMRADVPYAGPEMPGTVVVDLRRRYLYLVLAPGRARRYGVAVGPEAAGFSGLGVVSRKESWPAWSPGGAASATLVPGGPKSPRGARGLFLAANGQETGFVIHGTPDPMIVGTAARTGGVSLINQDIIDLSDKVAVGTRILVLG